MQKELFDLVILPRINAEVLEILNRHLSNEQIALLILTDVNPFMLLSQQQEAVLRGVDPKTLRGMKERGEISRDVKPESSRNLPKSGRGLPDSPQSRGRSPRPV